MKRSFIFSILALFSSLFMNQIILSQSNSVPPIILIMDGSGSMWGQIDGKTKIGIAREVVGQVLDEMDAKRPVGLVAYGHRQKGDCEDIENIMDPAIDNRDAIKSALQKLNPVGKTPLANTALQVIEKLKSENGSATIILVSDGAESCGGDLCAVVKAAKEAGVDFVLHIVGFDIGESDKLALECAANEGGGLYLDAENGDQLASALQQATELTVDEIENTLSVKVTKDGVLHDAVIKIHRPDEQSYFTSKRSYDREKTNPALLPLSPGIYHINVELLGKGSNTEGQWRKDVEIRSGELEIIEFNFTAGKISILATANQNELWDCVVHIKKTGENKNAAGGRTYKSERSNPMIKELTPGFYDVDISAMKLQGANIKHSFSNVEVKAGETLELEHDFEYGELSIFSSNNGALWDCVINVFKAGDNRRTSLAGGRTYNSANHNPFIELMTPGKYSVHYNAHHIHGDYSDFVLEDLEVKAREKTEAVHNFETGVIHFDAKHNGEPCTIDILMTQDGKSVFNQRLSPSKKKDIVMTPGYYEVTVTPIRIDAPKQTFSVTVKVGEKIEKAFNY